MERAARAAVLARGSTLRVEVDLAPAADAVVRTAVAVFSAVLTGDAADLTAAPPAAASEGAAVLRRRAGLAVRLARAAARKARRAGGDLGRSAATAAASTRAGTGCAGEIAPAALERYADPALAPLRAAVSGAAAGDTVRRTQRPDADVSFAPAGAAICRRRAGSAVSGAGRCLTGSALAATPTALGVEGAARPLGETARDDAAAADAGERAAVAIERTPRSSGAAEGRRRVATALAAEARATLRRLRAARSPDEADLGARQRHRRRSRVGAEGCSAGVASPGRGRLIAASEEGETEQREETRLVGPARAASLRQVAIGRVAAAHSAESYGERLTGSDAPEGTRRSRSAWRCDSLPRQPPRSHLRAPRTGP